MTRIPRGSYVIEPYRLNHTRYLSMLKYLNKHSLEEIRVTSYPSVFAGSVFKNRRFKPLYYVVTFYSIILTSVEDEELLNRIVSEFPGIEVYVLARDAWIDNVVLNLADYILILEKALNNTSNCIGQGLRVGDYVVQFKCSDRRCCEVVVLDFVNAPFQWVFGRRMHSDEIYAKALEQASKSKPREHILSFTVDDQGGLAPLAIYRPSDYVVEINLSRNCGLEEYVVWLITDLLLG